MLKRALLPAALLLALPGSAGAATVTRVDAATVRYDATAGIRDLVTFSLIDGGARIQIATANVGDTIASVGCEAPVAGVVRCARAGVGRIVVALGDGQDVTTVAPGFPIPFTVTGGTGSDVVDGSTTGDTLRGEADGDFFNGRGGPDDIGGGPGFDGVRFTGLGPVTVSLDDVANDGQAGGTEGANVRADVEDVSGSSGPDVITGSAGANELRGGDGDDRITGGGGADFFDLGGGADTAFARDGIGERIVCGDGADTVSGDDTDALGGCETASLSGELVRDLDRDGVAKPGDCNDGNAAIRPGAPDAPDDGVDQDCDGADATDRDRDGDGVPRPFDCDDADPKAAPGKRERFGNRRDEDCSGRADPLQTITTQVRARFLGGSSSARISRLQVVRPQRGTKIQVRCSGPGCAFARKAIRVRRGGQVVNLRERLGLRRIARQRLEVRLLRADSIGRVVRFTGRGGALPTTRILCLVPGRARPGSCR
jgi:hypothetical protein